METEERKGQFWSFLRICPPGKNCVPPHKVQERLCDDVPCVVLRKVLLIEQCHDIRSHPEHAWDVHASADLGAEVHISRCPGRVVDATTGQMRWERAMTQANRIALREQTRRRVMAYQDPSGVKGWVYATVPLSWDGKERRATSTG